MGILNSLSSLGYQALDFINPVATIQLQKTAKKDCVFWGRNGPGENANNKPEVVTTKYLRYQNQANGRNLVAISKQCYDSHLKIMETAYRSELAATNPEPVGPQNSDGSYPCASYWGEKHIAVNWKKLAVLASIAGIVITASTRIL